MNHGFSHQEQSSKLSETFLCSVEVREGTKVSWGGMNMCVSVCAYGMWDVRECKMHDMSVYVCDMCGICDMMCVVYDV